MKNIVFSLGASVASRAILLLINILSFRVLSAEKYGEITLFLAISVMVGAVSNMGSNMAINSQIARFGFTDNNKIFINYNYLFSFVFSFLLTAFFLIFYYKSFINYNYFELLIFIFFYTIFGSFNAISESILLGVGRFRDIFVNNFLTLTISIPFCFYLIGNMGLYGVIYSLIVYKILLLIFNFMCVKKLGELNFKKWEINGDIISKFKNYSVPVIFSGFIVALAIGLAFKVMTLQDGGLEKLGFFNIVYQIYIVSTFIPNALNGYLIAKFSANSSLDSYFYKVVSFNFIFSLLVATLLYIFRDLVFILVGNDGVNLIDNYKIMLFTISIFSVSVVFTSYWTSIGKSWLGFYLNILWSITLLVVVYIFVYLKSPVALAWGFCLAYLISTVLSFYMWYFLKKDKGI